MSSPTIFIVDDEAPARQRLTTLLDDIQPECPNNLVGEASDAQSALEGILAQRPDIVLLDVQMPGMTGLELAQHLQTLSQQQATPVPTIIFVTAYDDYALKAFEVHAIDYLLKPVRASRLAEAINRAGLIHARSKQAVPVPDAQDSPPVAPLLPNRRQSFSIFERNRVLLIPVADVLYLKAEQKYLTLHTKTRNYLLEESLTSIEHEMADVFVRAHRNALVARNAIIGVERALFMFDADSDHEKVTESWQVILRDCTERLPISRRQWPVIKALVR
ncbi:LytTR family DNA-binding domain-containing protein [Undibacterium sp. 5I1]|uniref:LytR/AlgR family response regulator transcription factor n=1 Tax=unclassified Undibacterium TaxID=2630295 RepID=UPI002AB5B339|nr:MULTISPECIES: LytTR family DNA-binding domain-containing protein [unclassified Undibacterium]MDY7537206.1 LytTR family DNA-binding domain-containing protein [Undibacterium sp. 5I1]MEB0231495.1 LytTR family DNA-binding domain-containing protein [Undibacterium sp. 10I3]MEB0259002.1 LytTR family DNA-binding domain-containing protein [Undibacterium sp. 5I1]